MTVEEPASFLEVVDQKRGLRAICFPNRRITALALAVCVVVPTLLVALQIDRNPRFSPIDEGAHWDYVKRVGQGEIPRLGEKLEVSTLRELSCRGTYLPGLVIPSCRARHLRHDQYPAGAEQYEAQQPPTYYALTVPMRWFNQHALGLADVPATRVAGIYWLVLGLMLLWCAGRIIGLEAGVLASVILFLTTFPLVLYHASIVSNDAASVFAGALAAFVVAIAVTRPGRWRAPVLLVTGFFVTFIKTTDGMPVLALSALLLVAYWMRNRERSIGDVLRRWLPTGGALLIGAAFGAVLWIVIQRSIALIDPRDLVTFGILRTNAVGPQLIFREAERLFDPVNQAQISAHTLGQNTQIVLGAFAHYLVLGAALTAFFVAPRKWAHALGILSLGSLYLGGVLFGIGIWINYDTDPSISGRYGLSIEPLLVLVLAAALRGTWAKRAVWALALAYSAQTLVVMLA